MHISIAKAAPSPSASPKPASPAPAPAQLPADMEEFTDNALRYIFEITVDPSRTAVPQFPGGAPPVRAGARCRLLEGLSAELSEEGKPLRLSLATLDSALQEAGTMFPPEKHLLDYFLPSWRRAFRWLKAPRGLSPEQVKAVTKAKKLAMSNCVLATSVPALFG